MNIIFAIPDIVYEISLYFNTAEIGKLRRVNKTFSNACNNLMIVKFKNLFITYIYEECDNSFEQF